MFDQGGTVETSGCPDQRSRKAEIFIAYSHDDLQLQQMLVKHLAALKREGLVQVWYDREIYPGAEWNSEIRNHLGCSDVIVLLVSASFMASDYCYGIELREAMERHEQQSAIVIPVILRDVDWKAAPFARLQALPRDAKPVTSWSNIDEALADVARGIRTALVRVANIATSRRHDLLGEYLSS